MFCFFAIGHLVYIYTFINLHSPSLKPYTRYIVILYIVIIIACMAQIIMDKIKFDGKYKVMIIYSLVLISSFVFAAIRGVASIKSGNTAHGIVLALSGALFIVSDAFLGSQLFGESKVKNPGFFVAITYFPAQTLFALSIYFQ